MELAWQWRGYGISIKLLREKARTSPKPDRTEENIEPAVPTSGSEKAYRDHLMASGSRYVGPIR